MLFANKLTDKNIFYSYRKIIVKVAVQTLSASVANALEFLMSKNYPHLVGSKATINFIRIIGRLFDYLNSRDLYSKDFKRPTSLEHQDFDEEMLNSSFIYLPTLRINGTSILNHPRKTFVLGFFNEY